MEQLPQEVLQRVVDGLDDVALKHTLTVNKRFQWATERAHWGFEYVFLRDGDLDDFIRVFSRHGRLRYLKILKFAVKLPPLALGEDDIYVCRESQAQLDQRDEDYSRQIHALFKALRALEDVCSPAYFRLVLPAAERDIVAEDGCLHPYHVSWRVHLLRPHELPSVESVTELSLDEGYEHLYEYGKYPTLFNSNLRSILDLSSKLPNLSTLSSTVRDSYDNWSMDGTGKHFYRRWEGPRRDSRHSFVEANRNGIMFPALLRSLRLDFGIEMGDMDQRQSLPDLLHPGAPYDLFSSSLRILTYHLRELKLSIAADSTLFWPTDHGDNNTPFWPYLESVNINFHASHPAGYWYFNAPPGPGGTGRVPRGYTIDRFQYPPLVTTEQECETWDYESFRRDTSSPCGFRFYPDFDALEPFLVAFARAACQMPCLKEAVLWTQICFDVSDSPDTEYDGSGEDVWLTRESVPADWPKRGSDNEQAWGVTYLAPNVVPRAHQINAKVSGSRQIWWLMGPYRPSLAIRACFGEIGAAQYEDHVIEHAPDLWPWLSTLRDWCLDDD